MIVDGNYVVSTGHNLNKSHPLQATYNQRTKHYQCHNRMHAEMAALVASRRHNLVGAEIFIFRENFVGELAMCRPCSACQAALFDAGIRDVYYTSETGMHFEKWTRNPFNGEKTGWVKPGRSG